MSFSDEGGAMSIASELGHGLLNIGKKVVSSSAAQKIGTGAVTAAGGYGLFTYASGQKPSASGLADTLAFKASPTVYVAGKVSKLFGEGFSKNVTPAAGKLASFIETHPTQDAEAVGAAAVAAYLLTHKSNAENPNSGNPSIDSYNNLFSNQLDAQSRDTQRQFAELQMNMQQQQAMFSQQLNNLMNTAQPAAATSRPASIIQRVTIGRSTVPKKKKYKKKASKKKKKRGLFG